MTQHPTTQPSEGVHTPGPWRIVDDFEIETGGAYVAQAYYATNSEATAMSNARLIAAAPDLLEALIEVMPSRIFLGNRNLPDSTTVPINLTLGELRMARAAIAKATGK